MSDNRTPERLAVAKTYKLYIGGSFPRSESGRVYPVHDGQGAFLANAAQASRKDVRDAVAAARKAFGSWSGATAYNRGQVLFRIAEVMEGRREQFAAEIVAAEGLSHDQALSTVDQAVDRMVWYAGWTDKISMVLGAANPVAGPYFSFSVPEPTGVVGVLAPQDSALLGLVSVVAPVIAAGNTCVVVASADRPLPAVTFAEVLATSDVPGGVVNVLTGQAAELAPWLAAHADVNALDPTGAPAELRTELARAAADTVKRVLPVRGEPDWAREPDLQRLRAFTEVKTVWHPVGT
ncbi:aldehyde dehydrogenase (NAD+) [Saccharopolyspora shandongensis]|uniref:Aldehyde dehydrogenase (NAD+) n=1 Tax=Saccharopolyspora shandongensis TaxID=418495 RepID=A0A1H3EZ86_9PSEU|nr:aldehyde dehydrogenase family protein [Saccharopolyspora shandongensis]SDX84061.1 aldehyde dehydrogenase (NAD+) [Saccharopolyspora shandongensis]